MTVRELMDALSVLESQGYSKLEVFYRHGASGDCGEVGSFHVTDEVDECGPFNIDEGEKYVLLYVGN